MLGKKERLGFKVDLRWHSRVKDWGFHLEIGEEIMV